MDLSKTKEKMLVSVGRVKRNHGWQCEEYRGLESNGTSFQMPHYQSTPVPLEDEDAVESSPLPTWFQVGWRKRGLLGLVRNDCCPTMKRFAVPRIVGSVRYN